MMQHHYCSLAPARFVTMMMPMVMIVNDDNSNDDDSNNDDDNNDDDNSADDDNDNDSDDDNNDHAYGINDAYVGGQFLKLWLEAKAQDNAAMRCRFRSRPRENYCEGKEDHQHKSATRLWHSLAAISKGIGAGRAVWDSPCCPGVL